MSLTVRLLFFLLFLGAAFPSNSQFRFKSTTRELDSLHAIHRAHSYRPAGNANWKPFYISTIKGQAQVLPVNSYTESQERQTAICYDTSGRFFLKDPARYFYTYTPSKTADGNLLV